MRQAPERIQGLKADEPARPIMIDPETRDIVQTVYIRRVEKLNGILYNVEFDQIPGGPRPRQIRQLSTAPGLTKIPRGYIIHL